MKTRKVDIAISGAGLAGLTAAWACASAGYNVALIAPDLDKPEPPSPVDQRTTALLASSIDYLKQLEIWQQVETFAAPLKVMRIIDATNRLVRAPQVDFKSDEIGLEAFGENIENAVLTEALKKVLKPHKHVSFVNALVDRITDQANDVEIELGDGSSINARFLIGADGGRSPTRAHISSSDQKWEYPQVAMVTNFNHDLPHDDVSTEFHRENGPFTIVPLIGNRSSLVWVDSPQAAKSAMALTPEDLNLAIEQNMHSILGKVAVTQPLQSFPLSALVAGKFGLGRIALVGEAAHVMPPIGAQGFNLGIRDIKRLIELLQSAPMEAWLHIGERYHLERSRDIRTRVHSVDLFNRTLLTGFLPIQIIRSTGLSILGTISPLRRFIMRQGVTGD